MSNITQHIVTGVLVEKDGKYLMVQELKKMCYMQWNIPIGHLEVNESLQDGACREAKEESGYSVKLTGLISIQHHYDNDHTVVRFTYLGEIVSGNPSERLNSEINDVKWFTFNELEKMNQESKLRGGTPILQTIETYQNGKLLPLDMVTTLVRIFENEKG